MPVIILVLYIVLNYYCPSPLSTHFDYFQKESQRGEKLLTGSKATSTESQASRCTAGEGRNGASFYRFNSLLDPNLAVYDLDTININPRMFDNVGS